jgi:hypothetical protein
MSDEPTAVYDNPDTYRREFWRGGKVVCSVADMVIFDRMFPEMCRMHQLQWADRGPFAPGTVWGSREAIDPTRKGPHRLANVRPFIDGNYKSERPGPKA